MPTSTYDLIASNVLTSSASSVTFSSIPATYRDLVLVYEAVDDSVAGNIEPFIRFNSDSGSNYNGVLMYGDGSSTGSTSYSNQTAIFFLNYFSAPNNDKALNIIQIFDYSATDKHKTLISRANNSARGVEALAGRWADTSAITSLLLSAGSGRTFDSGSNFYLYGIVS